VLFFILFYGRVLGISGIFGELVAPTSKQDSVWRVMFLGGLVLIGLAVKPSAEFQLSKMEAATAGFAVGFGTTLGRGCTSGHGLCGLARLSLRSFSAVLTFMLSGMITRTLLLKEHDTAVPFQTSLDLDQDIAFSLAGILVFFLVSVLVGRQVPQKYWKAATDVNALIIGLFFGFGLIKAGMTDPNKVKSFLALPTYFEMHPRGLFAPVDPSLLFVMMGGMLPNLILHPYVLRKFVRPIYAEKWQLPTRKNVDWHLLVGAATFGFGWALGGICPGPGIVVAIPRLLEGNVEMLYWWMWNILGLKMARIVQNM
jgi:uncharacterized membrane protein YedE/YeeE